VTSGSAPNARIGVKWTYEDGQVVDESEQVIAPQGSAATEFHITKPDGLPAGNYKVEVSVDGALLSRRTSKSRRASFGRRRTTRGSGSLRSLVLRPGRELLAASEFVMGAITAITADF
jgi:hypothetical protein